MPHQKKIRIMFLPLISNKRRVNGLKVFHFGKLFSHIVHTSYPKCITFATSTSRKEVIFSIRECRVNRQQYPLL